jgi:hypothetical protein
MSFPLLIQLPFDHVTPFSGIPEAAPTAVLTAASAAEGGKALVWDNLSQMTQKRNRGSPKA